MSKHVLIADDSLAIRRLAVQALAPLELDIDEVEDGQQALDWFGRPGVVCHLLLTDLHMPHVDGLTLVRRLRADPAFAGMPILMVSSAADDATRAAARTAGANGLMGKPFLPERLLALCQHLLARSD